MIMVSDTGVIDGVHDGIHLAKLLRSVICGQALPPVVSPLSGRQHPSAWETADGRLKLWPIGNDRVNP